MSRLVLKSSFKNRDGCLIIVWFGVIAFHFSNILRAENENCYLRNYWNSLNSSGYVLCIPWVLCQGYKSETLLLVLITAAKSQIWTALDNHSSEPTHKYKTFGEGFIFGEMEEGIIIILKIKQGKKYWNCKSFLTSFLYLSLLFENFLKWMLWSRDRNEIITSLKISGF